MHNNNITRQPWEHTLLNQLKSRIFENIARNISSKWKMIAMQMNIDPNVQIIPYTSSKIPIELANKMLAVAADQNKTVGDLNKSLINNHMNAYIASLNQMLLTI